MFAVVVGCVRHSDDLLSYEGQNGARDDTDHDTPLVGVLAFVFQHVEELVQEEIVIEYQEQAIDNEDGDSGNGEPLIRPEWHPEGISDQEGATCCQVLEIRDLEKCGVLVGDYALVLYGAITNVIWRHIVLVSVFNVDEEVDLECELDNCGNEN